ncbi:MAG: hypothetical protein RI894_2136 [Bacteroidota bacterium]
MTGFEPATLWSQTKCATGLRYIPIGNFFVLRTKRNAEEAGFEPAVQFPVRQFSKLVVSATHPSLRRCTLSLASAKIRQVISNFQIFATFF